MQPVLLRTCTVKFKSKKAVTPHQMPRDTHSDQDYHYWHDPDFLGSFSMAEITQLDIDKWITAHTDFTEMYAIQSGLWFSTCYNLHTKNLAPKTCDKIISFKCICVRTRARMHTQHMHVHMDTHSPTLQVVVFLKLLMDSVRFFSFFCLKGVFTVCPSVPFLLQQWLDLAHYNNHHIKSVWRIPTYPPLFLGQLTIIRH